MTRDARDMASGALSLAEGRLTLLMKAELPGSDHPTATEHVLRKVREALALLAETAPSGEGEPGEDWLREIRERVNGRIPEHAEWADVVDIVDQLRADIRTLLSARDETIARLTRERDEAREYAARVRIREKAVEDARVSAQDQVSTLEARLAVMGEALGTALDAMLEIRAASIEGAKGGYCHAGDWADKLFASHGGLTNAIGLIRRLRARAALAQEEERADG